MLNYSHFCLKTKNEKHLEERGKHWLISASKRGYKVGYDLKIVESHGAVYKYCLK